MQSGYSVSLKQFEHSQWTNVVPCAEILGTSSTQVLLHAGPPIQAALPAAIRQAAMLAVLFEGLAGSMAEAYEMIDRGAMTFLPAQDYGIATPLAHVVSPGMALAEVSTGTHRAFAPLVEGTALAARFGHCDLQVMTRMRQITDMGLTCLAPALRQSPVSLGPIIATALAKGDECHARTTVANSALIDAMPWLDSTSRNTLNNNPSFVLPILMAAAKTLLIGTHSHIHSVGGNGHHFGIRLHKESHWRVIPATPPVGTRFEKRLTTVALGAIGDSAVIDFCGLGGQMTGGAPDLLKDWSALLPMDINQHRTDVIDASSGFVDLEQIAKTQAMPMINLAILDLDGTDGLIGRGFYQPEKAAFLAAFCAQ